MLPKPLGALRTWPYLVFSCEYLLGNGAAITASHTGNESCWKSTPHPQLENNTIMNFPFVAFLQNFIEDWMQTIAFPRTPCKPHPWNNPQKWSDLNPGAFWGVFIEVPFGFLPSNHYKTFPEGNMNICKPWWEQENKNRAMNQICSKYQLF